MVLLAGCLFARTSAPKTQQTGVLGADIRAPGLDVEVSTPLQVFERVWPYHITSVDGRMTALLNKSSSEIMGQSVSSIFENEADKDAVFMCGSCANQERDAWFAFQGSVNGSLKGSSLQLVVGPVVEKANAGRPAASAFLELVALPLLSPPERGAVARYEISPPPLSPHEHVDAVLARRLGASVNPEQDDHAALLQEEEEDRDDSLVGFSGLGVRRSARPFRAKRVDSVVGSRVDPDWQTGQTSSGSHKAAEPTRFARPSPASGGL